MKTVIMVGIACICLVLAGRAEELSTSEFPSEDELYEAYLSGELEYEEYVLLLQLLQDGIDSTDAHLFDLVPNGVRVRRGDSLLSELEAIQIEPFQQNVQGTSLTRVKYGYYQRLEERGRSKYAGSLVSRFGGHWDVSATFRRDLSGRERVTGRSVRYQADSGFVREVRAGTFSRRLGLGTVLGYHGRLLPCEGKLNGESVAFPDFGGGNGVYAKVAWSGLTVEPVVSVQRSSSHSVATSAASVTYAAGATSVAVIASATKLRNRLTDSSLADYKTALSIGRQTKQNSFSLEYCAQAGWKKDFGTIVIEGTQRLQGMELQVAGWAYGDDYLDITGGSRAVSLRRRVTLEDIELSFSDKRSGQEGGLLRTRLDVAKGMRWSNTLLMAARNEDTSAVQWMSEFDHRLSKQITVSASLLVKENERAQESKSERKVRAGVKYVSGRLTARSYVGQAVREGAADYLSWLSDVRYRLSRDTRLQVWSNLGRWVNGSVEYWYVFGKTEQQILKSVSLSTKLMYRYDRAASQRRQLAINLEVAAGI